jgi:hypothetical protein
MNTINTDENQIIQRSISSSSSERNTEDKETPVTPSSARESTVYDWESDKRRSKPFN